MASKIDQIRFCTPNEMKIRKNLKMTLKYNYGSRNKM